MKLAKRIMTQNPCYQAGKKRAVKGLMLHSVGVGQPKAEVFIKAWNRADYRRACVHGFIDANDGTVYQTLPWEYRGWHCGSGKKGSANNTHIGVEMCEPAEISYTGGAHFRIADKDLGKARAAAARTYEAAVELFAMLCRKYGLDPEGDGVILSHSEGHRRGIASDHADPEHLWRQLGMDNTMDGFRKAVKAKMEQENPAEPKEDSPMTDSKSMTNADCPFVVRIRISDLNIRKGAGTNTAKTGQYTGVGAYTIVQVKPGKGSVKGWGLLKSKAGWISLDYCERI